MERERYKTEDARVDNSHKDDSNLTWWEEFKLKEKDNPDFVDIFALFDKATRSTTEGDLNKVILAVKGINKSRYEEEISLFDKRIRILQNRIERQISDDFSSMLKTLRSRQGYSLAKLSEETGISASYINRLELGARKAPSLPIIKKLAEALNFPIGSSVEVAGLDSDDKNPPTVVQLLYANSLKLTEDSDIMPISDKEELIEIVDFIINMDWDKEKHLDTIKLFDLIDTLKNKQKNKQKSK